MKNVGYVKEYEVSQEMMDRALEMAGKYRNVGNVEKANYIVGLVESVEGGRKATGKTWGMLKAYSERMKKVA